MERLYPSVNPKSLMITVFSYKKPLVKKSPRRSSTNMDVHRSTCSLHVPQMPRVSSKHWCIYEIESEEVISSSKDQAVVEVASLSKIMTCLLGITLADKFNIPWDTTVTISEAASTVSGTSAKLKHKDQVLLIDLFYGLMLPSGNDAAVAIAEFFGALLGHGANAFIGEMNRTAKELKLFNTYFNNPHGLCNKPNVSTARDICKLAAFAMNNSRFARITNTESYCASIGGEKTRELKWRNTNKLLSEGFFGVKTGNTTTAGPCLCVTKKISPSRTLVITLLKCKSLALRFQETKVLADWATDHYQSLLTDY